LKRPNSGAFVQSCESKAAVFPSFLKGWISRAELHRLNAIGNPLEKKIQLTRAQGFPESVFTDLWRLLPDRVVRSFQQRQVSQMDNA